MLISVDFSGFLTEILEMAKPSMPYASRVSLVYKEMVSGKDFPAR